MAKVFCRAARLSPLSKRHGGDHIATVNRKIGPKTEIRLGPAYRRPTATILSVSANSMGVAKPCISRMLRGPR